MALLGPSGCGKSTTLRLRAGLDLPDEGTITIDGRDVTGMPAAKRNLSMVFQSYALFPHLSVAENVMFGMKARRIPKAKRLENIVKALKVTGLIGYEDRKPAELSGGQRQRVALARAIVAGVSCVPTAVRAGLPARRDQVTPPTQFTRTAPWRYTLPRRLQKISSCPEFYKFPTRMFLSHRPECPAESPRRTGSWPQSTTWNEASTSIATLTR